MRRLLTTLIILITVLAAGLTALVLLVNPNEFRGYMVKEVERKSGYRLNIEGDLRWHVWPQLSILANKITLTASGAEVPLISADNMRLDVKLLPLISHKIEVRQVLLDNAVFRVMPESASKRPEGAPIAPKSAITNSDTEPNHTATMAGKLDINRIEVSNSLLIWQRTATEQINIRDLNFTLKQGADNLAKINLSSRINRNQRDLGLAVESELDLSHYPNRLSANVTSFNYSLQGANIPTDGISGNGRLTLSYLMTPKKFSIDDLSISLNKTEVKGKVSATLDETPDIALTLTSPKIDLDELLGDKFVIALADSNGAKGSGEKFTREPIIASPDYEQHDLSYLKSFNAEIDLTADETIFRGLTLNQLKLSGSNQQGKVRLDEFSAKLLGGTLSLEGGADNESRAAQVWLNPKLNNVDISPLLKAFQLPEFVGGTMTMQGKYKRTGTSKLLALDGWQGSAHISMNNAKLYGLNMQQLVQQVAEQSDSGIKGLDEYPRYTAIQELKADTVLHSGGELRFTQLFGRSNALTVGGTGSIDFTDQQCDMKLKVKVIEGWRGKPELINFLQDMVIPLRVYGPWKQLNYHLDVDNTLKDKWMGDAKKALSEWLKK